LSQNIDMKIARSLCVSMRISGCNFFGRFCTCR